MRGMPQPMSGRMAPPCWFAGDHAHRDRVPHPEARVDPHPHLLGQRLQQPLADRGEVRLAQRRRGVRVGVRVFPPVRHAQHDPAAALLRAGLEVGGPPDRQPEQHGRRRLRAVDGLVGHAAPGRSRGFSAKSASASGPPAASTRALAAASSRVSEAMRSAVTVSPGTIRCACRIGDDPVAHPLADGGQVVERLGQRRVRTAALCSAASTSASVTVIPSAAAVRANRSCSTAPVTTSRAISGGPIPLEASCATASVLPSATSSRDCTCSSGTAVEPTMTADPTWLGPEPHPLTTTPTVATTASARPTCLYTQHSLSRRHRHPRPREAVTSVHAVHPSGVRPTRAGARSHYRRCLTRRPRSTAAGAGSRRAPLPTLLPGERARPAWRGAGRRGRPGTVGRAAAGRRGRERQRSSRSTSRSCSARATSAALVDAGRPTSAYLIRTRAM